MNILPKLIRSIWLLINLLAIFGFALPAHTSGLSPHVIAYNAQTQSSIAYDEASISVFDYDLAFILPANESENESVGTGGIFAKFVEFLAAKGAQTGAGGFLGSADEAYAAIRASTSDVGEIFSRLAAATMNAQLAVNISPNVQKAMASATR